MSFPGASTSRNTEYCDFCYRSLCLLKPNSISYKIEQAIMGLVLLRCPRNHLGRILFRQDSLTVFSVGETELPVWNVNVNFIW